MVVADQAIESLSFYTKLSTWLETQEAFFDSIHQEGLRSYIIIFDHANLPKR